LLLAKPDPDHGWLYVGRVGTGFSDELMREVTKKLGKGGGKKPTAHVGTTDTDLRTATWFAPKFVVEVFFRGIGRQQLLRQPSLKAVRWDKDVDDLADSDRGSRAEAPDLAKTKPKGTSAGKARKGKQADADARALPKLSSPTKVPFTEERITKRKHRDFYAAVHDHPMQ